MTAPEPEYEWGVEWRWRDGRTFISVVSQTHAEAIVDDHDPREYNPHPVRIVRRPVAEWLPAPTEETQATCEHGETTDHPLFDDGCPGPKDAAK